MNIGRTLPPAAAPIPWRNILKAFSACCRSGAQPRSILQDQLQAYFKVRHCFLLSSGQAALTVILKALHTLNPEKDQVLIPAFTCFSVPAAIKRAGLKIRLCDVDPATLDFDRDRLYEIAKDASGSKRLLCVVPTHLFGLAADVQNCRAIFSRQNSEVFIVEDAAQALGSEQHNQRIGTTGDVGFFSLGRGKALSTFEGGIIVTKREEIGKALAEQISVLGEYSFADKVKLFGKALCTALLQHPALFWLPKSLPFLRLGETIYEPNFSIKNLSAVQVVLAKDWQNRLNWLHQNRKANIAFFSRLITGDQPVANIPWATAGFPLIRLPLLTADENGRRQIIKLAERQGLGIMPAYPGSINEIPVLAKELRYGKYPGAALLSRRLLTIPTHSYMQHDDYLQIFHLLGATQKEIK